jgi:hypothetical protein
MSSALRQHFAAGLHLAFLAGTAISAIGLAVTLFLPPVDFASHDASHDASGAETGI